MGRGAQFAAGLVAALCVLIVTIACPGVAVAAACTDTWIGPEAGEWTEAESWSAAHVPTEEDVACIPKSHRVTVGSGAQRAEMLQGSGELVITEASLVLVGVGEPSNIGTMRLKEGGEFGGTGEIFVTDQLIGLGGLMKGEGFTKIGAEATGEVVGGEFGGQPGLRVTQKRVLGVHGSMGVGGEEGELRVIEGALLTVDGSFKVHGSTGKVSLRDSADLANSGVFQIEGPEARLAARENSTVFNYENLTVAGKVDGLNVTGTANVVNEGQLTIAGTEGEARIDSTKLENSGEVNIAEPAGKLVVTEGALIENEGFIRVNSEAAGSGLVVGSYLFASHLVNSGTVVKTQGIGVSVVEVPIDNESVVETQTGILMLSGGGSSGQEAPSEWVAQSENLYTAETKLAFALDNFSLGDEATVSGEAQILSGGSVTVDAVDGEEGSFWLYDGNLHIGKGGASLGELGVAGGFASLAAGAELSSEYLEITTAYLEGAGVESVEEPAEVLLATGSRAEVETLVQEQGTAQMGDGATFDGDAFIEAGAFTAGDQTTVEGSMVWVEEGGTFEAGAETQFLAEEPFNSGGILTLGANSLVSGAYFFQEEGSTNFGDGSTITEPEMLFIEEGSMVFGEGTSITLGEYFFQQGGETTFGPGVALSADEMAFFEEGPVAIEAGAEIQAENVHFEQSDVGIAAGAEVQAGYVELWGGEITGAGSIVTDTVDWWHTVLALTGTTEVLKAGKLGYSTSCGKTCEKIPHYATLRNGELILRGSFSTTVSTLGMSDGAKLVSNGTFDASSEENKWGAEIQVAPESTSEPIIVNRGSFEKQTGSGTTFVDVPFKNLGQVGQREGTLSILRPIGLPASDKFGIPCPCADPVEAATGAFYESQTDFAIGGLGLGLSLTRTYNAYAASMLGPFGYGWSASFGDRLRFEEEGAKVTVERADGSTVPFSRDEEGTFEPPEWSKDTLTGSAETGYVYTSANQVQRHFGASGALQSVVDRNGNATTLAYTEGGLLESIEDPAGRKIVLSYNGEGLVETAEDPMGHLVHYAYEGKQLTSVTLPGEGSPSWQFEYDPSHLMTTMIDGRGGKTTNEYDEQGRIISQTDPAKRTTSFEYDGFHTRMTNEATGALTDFWFDSNNQPTSVTRGFGTEAPTTDRFFYDEAGHNLARTDGNGHTTTFTYNAAGDRTSATDPLEHKTEWEYNGTHDVISETTPRGETTTIVRDAKGNPETVSRPAPGEATQTTSFAYDGLGQLESITDPLERTWSFGYDANGNIEAEADPEGNTRTWAYDENSQVTAIVSPRGNEEGAEPAEFTTAIERDAQGRPEKVIDPLGGEAAFAYDGNGNLKAEADANGHTTEFIYNAADEPIETKKPNGAVLKTEYDGAGEVVAQIDGNGKTTTYVRNELEQAVEIIDPLNRKTVQAFDPAGNVETVVDPMERVTGYSYDPAGRLEAIGYSEEATPSVDFDYDEDSNLTRMVDGSGESTFVYDQLGRLEKATNGHGDTVAYEYNLADEQEKIVYPNGKAVDRAFDGSGRLESVTDWLEGTTSFKYDADSNLESIHYPAPSGNVDEFAYDDAGRMRSVDFKKGAESLASIEYERDPLGQVEAMVAAGLPGPEEEAYEYDENERLLKAGAEAFEYDNADNPIKIPGSTNSFDPASQLETGTGVAYEYNPMGERTKATPSAGPATSYAYDQAANLTSVKRAAEGETPGIDTSYAFDGAGLLVARTSGSTRYFTWDTSAPLPRLLDDDVNSYIYGPNGLPITQINAEEEPTYLHSDQLASTRLLTDESGKAAASFTYTAYGQLAAETGTGESPLGYAGQYSDRNTGLQYLRARFYDPATAQFLSVDPLRAQTHMPYGYTDVDPINGSDPSGLIGLGDVGNFFKGTAESLNPIKYYKEEIECIEEGCNYWESVFKGSQGAVTAACDVTGLGALGKGLLGRGGSLVAKEAAGAIAGSTGRTEAASLAEQLAMQAARSDPAAGRVLAVTMSDSRWPATEGWVKMAQNVNGVEIHYVFNTRTGLATDFKFVP
jgi:RHS repeat-associated protein